MAGEVKVVEFKDKFTLEIEEKLSILKSNLEKNKKILKGIKKHWILEGSDGFYSFIEGHDAPPRELYVACTLPLGFKFNDDTFDFAPAITKRLFFLDRQLNDGSWLFKELKSGSGSNPP